MPYRIAVATVGLVSIALSPLEPVAAQETRGEQAYLPGGFNWSFLGTFPEAGRLFNAFDYGHAVLYERLLTRDGPAAHEALAKEYRYLTQDLLRRPPRFAIPEEAVMPDYAKLAWRAKQMFDWAHVLHRQIYDIYAADGRSMAEKDALIERVTDYYLSRTDLAFTPVPKSMDLMEAQSFSRTFRAREPAFNGLIWAYHWLQVGLYEPLIVAGTTPERRELIGKALGRFWAMVETKGYPTVMPMTPAVAPEFTRRHPRAAAIFDNLHMMHDIISDILASPAIPKDAKRDAIYAQLALFRDPVQQVISVEEWMEMAHHMGGVDAMGGPVVSPGRPR